MQFRTFSPLGPDELHCTFEPCLVGALITHERLEVAYLECLGEILVVIKLLGPTRFHIEHLEVEPLRPTELPPMRLGDTLRHEALVRAVSTANPIRPSTKLVSPLHARLNRLADHVLAVDHGKTGKNAQGRGEAGHLDVRILENVLVTVKVLAACRTYFVSSELLTCRKFRCNIRSLEDHFQ